MITACFDNCSEYSERAHSNKSTASESAWNRNAWSIRYHSAGSVASCLLGGEHGDPCGIMIIDCTLKGNCTEQSLAHS